jgi:hypothetical protein
MKLAKGLPGAARFGRRMVKFEANVLGVGKTPLLPQEAVDSAVSFSRFCLGNMPRAWKYRLRLSRVALTLTCLLASTGRYNAAASLLSNPVVFSMIRPGDGRWQEALKPVLDFADRSRLVPVLVMLFVASKRSGMANALYIRVKRRLRSRSAKEFMPQEIAGRVPPSMLPFILEAEVCGLRDDEIQE